MAIEKRKRKNNKYSYVVKVCDSNGKLYPTKTFKIKVDAQAYERELLNKKAKGKSSSALKSGKLSYSDYWRIWSKEARTKTSKGWQVTQDQMNRSYIQTNIGNLKLNKITTRDIGSILNDMNKIGRSGQTQRHVYNLLHKMFSDAIEYYEWLEVNPVKKKLRPEIISKPREFHSYPDAIRFMNAVKNHYLGPAIWIGYYSGLRPCEVTYLKVKHLDFHNHEILVRGTYNKKMRVFQHHTKSKNWTRIPMTKSLSDFLKRAVKNKGPEDFVAESSRGGMLNYDTWLRTQKKICNSLGLTEITPHELRHSTSNIWYHYGASESDITKLLNHSSSSVTQKYIHYADQRIKNIAQHI